MLGFTPIDLFILSTMLRHTGMDSCQAILPDTLRVNANLFQTDLCRNPDYMEVFKLTIPLDYSQDKPWHWIPASRRV